MAEGEGKKEREVRKVGMRRWNSGMGKNKL
jgi:hypothetical protein